MDILSPEARSTAGVLLLSILAVEFGGLFVLRLVRRQQPATSFQIAFARAGHAHAGVLVTLGLVAQILADATTLNGLPAALARSCIPVAAILMSAGFFLSSAGQGVTQPNRLIIVLYAGVVALGLGAGFLGIGLLTA